MQYLRDNAGVLEASNNGTDWETVVLGEGGGGTPSQVANPVTIGSLRILDDSGELSMSADAGVTFTPFYFKGTSLNLGSTQFYPPVFFQESEPTGLYYNSLTVWIKTSTGQVWILFKKEDESVKRVELV
jgi:hypothetical protein